MSADHACLICEKNCPYYFSKVYSDYPSCPFVDQWMVHYHKCPACGFVYSQTHRDLPAHEWIRLNDSWHHYYENRYQDRITNQPPYANQALALVVLAKNGLLQLDGAFDYAAGYGTLARVLEKYWGFRIDTYDPYVSPQIASTQPVESPTTALGTYGLVINSAMFEHVLTRMALDEVNSWVAPGGVLMLHSVICENVPNDPDWFYLKTIVHTAFHTNKSMELLMKQWGYEASVYVPQAKSWFLFKEGHPRMGDLEQLVNTINRELQSTFAIYKSGFVDYWKGF